MNTLWSFITAWFNVPFTALFVLSLLMSVVQVFGLFGEHDSDSDADADASADTHIDTDADADADADADTLDTSTTTEVGSEAMPLLNFLAFIGVGKAPLAIVLMLLLGSIAVLGWVLNGLAESWLGGITETVFIGVFVLALIGGVLMSSRLARVIGRALPPISTTASSAQDLVGKRGTVLSPYVDARYGLIRVRDNGGTSINVFGVTSATDAPIKRNSTVVLASYDAAKRQYLVTKF